MYRRLAGRTTVVTLLIAATSVLIMPAGRATDRALADRRISGSAVSADMLEALRRDLNLTADQVLVRLAREETARGAERRIRTELGDAFAGAWLAPEDQHLNVAVTDRSRAGRVRALGAEPRTVARSERQLQAIVAKLDASGAPRSVSSWYADVESNMVVVRADPTALGTAASFVRSSGVSTDAVRIEASTEVPRLLYDLRGGDKIGVSAGFCSLGFSIRHSIPNQVDPPGFVTAGHCADIGTATTGFNGVDQGTTRGSVFPGLGDYAWVQVNSNWNPQPWVNRYGGPNRLVHGAQPAPIGESVCRSGYASGFKCGLIEDTNVTVNYPAGRVSGLTRTSACATLGDSGGSFIAITQAQGVLSGGTGDCANGGTTFFQPIQEILDAYNLRLIVTPAPAIINMICEYAGNGRYFCHLSYASPSPVQIRWKVDNIAVPSWDDDNHVSGFCTIGRVVGVNVTVSNANGSATASDSFLCDGEPQ